MENMVLLTLFLILLSSLIFLCFFAGYIFREQQIEPEKYYFKGQTYIIRDNTLFVLTSLKPDEYKEVFDLMISLGKIKYPDDIIKKATL